MSHNMFENFSKQILPLLFHFEVCSSLTDIPQIKYGSLVKKESKDAIWCWLDVSMPTSESQEKVCSSYFLYEVLFGNKLSSFSISSFKEVL